MKRTINKLFGKICKFADEMLVPEWLLNLLNDVLYIR